MRRLLPDPVTDLDVEAAYAAPLGTPELLGGSRPWVMLCMVASIDGSTVLDGTSGGLSSPNDTAVLGQLRSIADVVLVGAGTVRQEGYGPPKTAGQRIGVVTNRGSVDTTTDLFRSGAGFVITTEQAEFDDHGVDVLRVGREAVDLVAALDRLDQVAPGARTVQAEGGPTLNASLADADLLDEIDLTISAGTIGGDGLRLTHGGDDHQHEFELAQVVVDDQSFLFTRWRRRR